MRSRRKEQVQSNQYSILLCCWIPMPFFIIQQHGTFVITEYLKIIKPDLKYESMHGQGATLMAACVGQTNPLLVVIMSTPLCLPSRAEPRHTS